MHRASKIELRPTATQVKYLRRCAGTMRFVYNFLVAKWKAGEKYNRKQYQKACSLLRQSTPWMQMVTCRATYEAADNFDQAVQNFFRSRSRDASVHRRWNVPCFKRKGRSDSFHLCHSEQFSVQGRNLRIPCLPKNIRMRENIRLAGTVKAVTIKLQAGKWFAIFLVETEAPSAQSATREPSVGVDFGLKSLAVLSTGETVENPQPLRRKIRLLRRRQRQVSKKFIRGNKRQSHRCQIAQRRVARLHKKVSDQRGAALHRFTSSLVKRFDRIVIEDLNVNGMAKNRRLSRAIADASWATLRCQLEYKSRSAGVELVVADRFFASSKTCSGCGHKVERLSLAQRTFICPVCAMSMNRDLNAAINLNRHQPSITTPPIRGSRKTRTIELRKSTPSGVVGSLDGANINLKGSPPCPNGQMVVIY